MIVTVICRMSDRVMTWDEVGPELDRILTEHWAFMGKSHIYSLVIKEK